MYQLPMLHVCSYTCIFSTVHVQWYMLVQLVCCEWIKCKRQKEAKRFPLSACKVHHWSTCICKDFGTFIIIIPYCGSCMFQLSSILMLYQFGNKQWSCISYSLIPILWYFVCLLIMAVRLNNGGNMMVLMQLQNVQSCKLYIYVSGMEC